jgi:hypothetical protein
LNLEEGFSTAPWATQSSPLSSTQPTPPSRSNSSARHSTINPSGPSIFSSGPAVTQVHIHTSSQTSPLHASPTGSVRRISAMSNRAGTPSSSRRSARFDDSNLSIMSPTRSLPDVEKDADDPTTSVESRIDAERRYNSTPTALTRLLAAQMITSPANSRQPSYNNQDTGSIARCELIHH